MSHTAWITRPPRDVAGWARCFEAASLPVLASTAEALEELRANEDAVDAHLLATHFSTDPLMTLKLLAHVARLRRGRDGSDPETVTAALVMTGISPFFRHFGPQPTVEDLLAEQPQALEGFHAVLARSHRAAHFALAIAVQRMDHDAAVIHEAALLHDFAELLLWTRAPALALEIASRQRVDPTLRSATVQQEVLNITLPALQHELMSAWRLPALLVHITHDERQTESVQVRNVVLAIRLARHTSAGWENPALADDLREIADLMHMGVEPTLALLREVDE